MKTIEPINHYTRKERDALLSITDAIVNFIHPLIIYCITSVSSTTIERSCFNAKQKIEEWSFECDLLIILPGGIVTNEDSKTQIEKLTSGFGKVTIKIHPVDYVVKQIKEGNPFFSVAHNNAVVIYEENNATRLLS